MIPQNCGPQNCGKVGDVLTVHAVEMIVRRERDSAALRLRHLGALPGGPGNHATAQRPDGRSGRFGIRRPRASSRPPHTKTARRLRAGLLLVAERARFELAIPFWGTHAFQACYPLLGSLLNTLIISYLNYYLSFFILCLRVICEFISYQR